MNDKIMRLKMKEGVVLEEIKNICRINLLFIIWELRKRGRSWRMNENIWVNND